jgi:hypothetical protein
VTTAVIMAARPRACVSAYPGSTCILNDAARRWLAPRITVMTNMAKSLQPPPADPNLELSAETAANLVSEIGKGLERLKWVALARQRLLRSEHRRRHHRRPGDALPRRRANQAAQDGARVRQLSARHAGRIPHYGERRLASEAIFTAFTESAVNQVISKRMVKKQQMRWTPQGAHLLLQIRTRVLNDQLASDFHRWYPNFTQAPDTAVLAA